MKILNLLKKFLKLNFIDEKIVCYICGAEVLCGILLSLVATALAVNKYLRMDMSDLYYI